MIAADFRYRKNWAHFTIAILSAVCLQFQPPWWRYQEKRRLDCLLSLCAWRRFWYGSGDLHGRGLWRVEMQFDANFSHVRWGLCFRAHAFSIDFAVPFPVRFDDFPADPNDHSLSKHQWYVHQGPCEKRFGFGLLLHYYVHPIGIIGNHHISNHFAVSFRSGTILKMAFFYVHSVEITGFYSLTNFSVVEASIGNHCALWKVS